MKTLHLALTLGALASVASPYAVPVLTLSEVGYAPLVIVDNGPFDISPVPGNIIFAGVFHNYLFQSDIGNTKPIIGSPTQPILGLANTTVTATPGAAPLTIRFEDSGFVPGSYLFSSGINGTLAVNNVTFTSYADGNVLNTYSGGPGAFDSGVLNKLYSSPAPISLALEAVISQPLGGITQFDANVMGTQVPDAGATAALLSLGVAGLAIARRKS